MNLLSHCYEQTLVKVFFSWVIRLWKGPVEWCQHGQVLTRSRNLNIITMLQSYHHRNKFVGGDDLLITVHYQSLSNLRSIVYSYLF